MSELNSMNDVLKYVAGVINAVHPDYVVGKVPASSYTKISLMHKYGDECIMRIYKSTKTAWFSLNVTPDMMCDDPLFDVVENKNKNHFKIFISSFDEIKKYEKFFVPIAEYLYETYEIAKYPCDGNTSSVLGADGIGISLGLKI